MINPNVLRNKDGDLPLKLGPVREGERLMEQWFEAFKIADRDRRQAEKTAGWCAEAEKSFAKWMLPPDAQVGEKICMWMGHRLVQAELTPEGPKLSIRVNKPISEAK